MARHCEAMVGFLKAGAEVFDYGNNLRGEAVDGGYGDAFSYPGFRPRLPKTDLLRRQGPVSVGGALGGPGGHPRDGPRRSSKAFPDDPVLQRWLPLAAERCRSRDSRRGSAGSATASGTVPGCCSTTWSASGEVKAPIVIGRDHLDSGSVASPYRETESMADGSDAIADWPILNALLNTASGATWVAVHHGGGTGMGKSIHAGAQLVVDGTDRRSPSRRADAHERPGHRCDAPRGRGLRHCR